MAQIKVLPEHLMNQIAAGEVVERPASVVKELIENSLDAGAQRLIIEVEGAGDISLRITDDGFGMDKEDALMALERHATSKISTTEDLFNIHTLGFRGEALASIASVSYFTLQTKKRGELEGSLVMAEGGKIKKTKELGCPEGTQIEVKNLFYNTPARKKYLKNDATEFGHILDTVTGIALAFPEVAFKLVHDKKTVFDLPATEDQLVRVRGLLGRSVADELIPVFYGGTNVQLEGFIGKPAIARANRNNQFLYVNRRQVRSHVLSYAVKQSYYSLLPKEKYPVFLFFVTLNPQLVDVNVHPRKQEVKFSNEKEIFSIFTIACKKALEKHVLAPKFTPQDSFLHTERPHQPLFKEEPLPAPQPSVNMTITVPRQEEENETEAPELSQTLYSDGYENNQASGNNALPSADIQASPHADVAPSQAETSQPSMTREEQEELLPLSQMDNSYILAQQGKNLVIIDQHAAHERIRYTEITSAFEKKEHAIQQLLAPEQIELSHQEVGIFAENKELFLNMGFEVEAFGGNTFSVYAVPSYLSKQDIRATIMGLIDDLQNNSNKGDFQTRKERALTYAACRSAVKFGDPLSREEQVHLCKRLMEMELPYTCPHGRPTMVVMPFDDLEKRFGRKYQ